MKKNPNRAFAALLALLTALCLCTVALASDSGTWGKLKWTIENGVLTISGKGKMEDCSVHGWDNWRMSQSKYSKAVIESGVTTIGANCFRSIDIKSISIPKTVTRIGGMACYWDVKLTSVTIPSSVTRIDGSAFCL